MDSLKRIPVKRRAYVLRRVVATMHDDRAAAPDGEGGGGEAEEVDLLAEWLHEVLGEEAEGEDADDAVVEHDVVEVPTTGNQQNQWMNQPRRRQLRSRR